MSDEDYNKRENTYRQWKKEQLAKDPTWCLEKAMAEKRRGRCGSQAYDRGRRAPGGGGGGDRGPGGEPVRGEPRRVSAAW